MRTHHILSLFLLTIGFGLFHSCIPYCNESNWGYYPHEFDQYEMVEHLRTPKGILFDPTGQDVSGELIDQLTDSVEACLLDAFPDGKVVDPTDAALCYKQTFDPHIDRNSFMVKIPNDWVLNCDKTQEVLPTPVKAGIQGCLNKGLVPTAECPCRWRAGIKCPNMLISTPSLYLYRDVLIRFVTTCSDPWGIQELAKCASPTTNPLGM